jgi:hypothetical protein
VRLAAAARRATAVTRAGDGDAAAAPLRRKTILLPWADDGLREFVAATCPVAADVVDAARAPLEPADVALLVVDSVDAGVRRLAQRKLRERSSFVMLVRRDVWTAGGPEARALLEEVQRDPRHKHVLFWRDREELERTLRKEVFTFDDSILVSQTVPDGAAVAAGSTFEQTWELENIGFRTWVERTLTEFASGCIEPAEQRIPVPHTVPGERIRLTATFTAPGRPGTCRSVWKYVLPDGRLALPWAHGIWCEVRVVA